MLAGLESNDKTPEERVAEAKKHQAELLARPRHPSVAHITPTPEAFMAAAEYHRNEGNLVCWLTNASMAKGIATALYEMTGHHGHREGALVHKAAVLRCEADLALVAELRVLHNPPEPTDAD